MKQRWHKQMWLWNPNQLQSMKILSRNSKKVSIKMWLKKMINCNRTKLTMEMGSKQREIMMISWIRV